MFQGDDNGYASEQCQRQVAAKCKAKKSGMRSDQHQNRERYGPCARVKFVTFHWSHRRYRQHDLKAADADRAAVDTAKSRLVEQRNDLAGIDVTMAVKVREQS